MVSLWCSSHTRSLMKSAADRCQIKRRAELTPAPALQSANAPSAIEAALARDENAPNYFNPGDRENIDDAAVRGIAVGVFGVLLFLAYIAFFLIRCVMCCCCGKVRMPCARLPVYNVGAWLPAWHLALPVAHNVHRAA